MVCPACPIAGAVIMATAGGASLALVAGVSVTGVVFGVGVVSYGLYNYIHKYEYFPHIPGDLDKDFKIYQSTGYMCIEGSRTSNFLTSTEAENNHFYGKNGVDVFKARDGSQDYFYFNLCTLTANKIKGNISEGLGYFTTTYKVVPTIYNFRDNEDSIRIFCSENSVTEDQVHVTYDIEKDSTLVKINIPVRFWGYNIPWLYGEEAIIVEGYHESLLGGNLNQIELNIPFADFCS